MGIITLNSFEPVNRSATVGMLAVHPSKAGAFHGIQAIRLLLDYAFGSLNLNRVVGLVFDGNRIYDTIYKRLGAVHEGTLRQAVFKGGEYVDKRVYSMLRDEYQAKGVTSHGGRV